MTLRERVLTVGGIKEKILAAVARGIKDVIIPRQNEKDLEDIPADLLKQITVHPVDTLTEVISIAFPKLSGKQTKAPKSTTSGGTSKSSPEAQNSVQASRRKKNLHGAVEA